MNVYYLAYELFGKEEYRTKAIYWLRSLIPFTHLWEPANVRSLYATKPCLCSSDWYFANWVRDHVQWEVQAKFDLYQQGLFDYCYADTHNTMTGNIGGMCIMPAITAALLYDLLDREAGK